MIPRDAKYNNAMACLRNSIFLCADYEILRIAFVPLHFPYEGSQIVFQIWIRNIQLRYQVGQEPPNLRRLSMLGQLFAQALIQESTHPARVVAA